MSSVILLLGGNMRLRMLKMAVLIGVMGALSACDTDGAPGSQANSPLVGTWTCCDGPVSTTYLFKGDGTCLRQVVTGAERPETEHGTWKVDDDGNLNLAIANGSPDPVQECHRLRVDSRTMVFADDGMRGNFLRIK